MGFFYFTTSPLIPHFSAQGVKHCPDGTLLEVQGKVDFCASSLHSQVYLGVQLVLFTLVLFHTKTSLHWCVCSTLASPWLSSFLFPFILSFCGLHPCDAELSPL